MNTIEISNLQGKQVAVTMRGFAGGENKFEGKVVDYNATMIWVEIECGDWISVNLANPYINTVEQIMVEPEFIQQNELKAIHKDLDKSIRYEDEITVSVKVYDCSENDEQTYDVEIQYAIGDELYTDCFVTDSVYTKILDDKIAEEMAVKRAKSVLKTVKGWYKNDDRVTVVDTVEVYNA